MIFSHFAPNARTCPGQKPHRSDPFWCSEARMRSVSVTCAGVSGGYAHDRRGERVTVQAFQAGTRVERMA